MSSEPSVDLEPGVTSPSLKIVKEDFMEPEDTRAGERGRLEISSNTDNQEEATKFDPGCLKFSLLTNNSNNFV